MVKLCCGNNLTELFSCSRNILCITIFFKEKCAARYCFSTGDIKFSKLKFSKDL